MKETKIAPILNWMERFDKWAQAKSITAITEALQKKGFKAYVIEDAKAILSEKGYVLVEAGDQLHIPYVLDHKVVWGGSGIIAITPANTIIQAKHTI